MKNDDFVEEGAVAMRLGLAGRETFEVVVIGAGQAGLSVGHHLARRGVRFVILDASPRIGDSWRRRWDSLRLFTPAKFDGLDGMRFPGPPNSFPTKDEFADYLESYAARFRLPVRSGVKVERLSRQGERYLIEYDGRSIVADQVVVAMASYQERKRPAFAAELAPGIVQLHSSDYRNLDQLPPGALLIAGAGNSGAEIAIEAARAGRPVIMAGRDVGEVPFKLSGWAGRLILGRLVLRVVFHRILTNATPMGRRMRSNFVNHGHPLIRTRKTELDAAGVVRVGKVARVEQGRPVLEDGRVLDVAAVVWCTGYEASRSFIDLPIFDEEGRPRHDGGVVEGEPGLYFVGLNFLYGASSTMIHGVGRDADRIAGIAAERIPARPVTVSAPAAATATARP
jgi:putative flavoprotein involved in K+ transport